MPPQKISESNIIRPPTLQQPCSSVPATDSVARNAKLRQQIDGLEEELNLQRMLDKDMVRESSRYSNWKPIEQPGRKKNGESPADDDLKNIQEEKDATSSFVSKLRKLRDMVFF